MKNQRGITLIALVITIIVLLILAGITINLTIGERGIITRAQEAGKNYLNAQEQEEYELNSFENEMDNIIKDSITYKRYSLGDEVTIKGEAFYVIKDSPANESTVTLLAKDNIDVATLKQSASAKTIAFSSTNYWSNETEYPYDLNGEKYASSRVATDAISIAKAYGESLGAVGRLMTKEEADILSIANSDLLLGRNGKSSSTYLNYWLGSAHRPNYVWIVYGSNSSMDNDLYDYSSRDGVRPVIEISKSLI